MARTLVLLTNHFPYSRGEEYLERELPYLAERFERIILVPTMRTRGMKPTRSVPAKVEVLENIVASGVTSKASQLWAGLSHRPDLRAGQWWTHPVRRAYEAYFEGRARAVVASIREANLVDRIEPDDQILIYSYWFYITARVAVLLARDELAAWAPPVVSRAHGYDINELASPVSYLPARESLLSGVDAVFPVAEFAAERLRTQYPAQAAKIHARRLGVADNEKLPSANRASNLLITCSTVRPLKRLAVMSRDVVA